MCRECILCQGLVSISQKTGCNERQFIEQVGQYWRLPRRLSDADLRAIARHNYPEGDEAMIEALAACASASDRFLSALLGAIKEVRYVAQNAGRTKPTMADVKKAAISQMQTAAHLAAAFGDRPLRQSEAAGPAPAPEKRIEIPTGRGILPVEATTTAN